MYAAASLFLLRLAGIVPCGCLGHTAEINGWRDHRQQQWTLASGVQTQDHAATVISGWMLLHMLGNHSSSMRHPKLPWLVTSLRNAIADCLGVCRPAVGIVDIRAVSVDIVDPWGMPYDQKDRLTLVQQSSRRVMRNKHGAMYSRGMHENVTQFRAVYEVRIFDEMDTDDAEVARRVDQLQIYGKYAEFNRMLQHSFVVAGAEDSVMLDDVGYANRRVLLRPPMRTGDVSDCAEEVLLKDARLTHQYVVALSFLLIMCIACAGSAVFTIKQPSVVPSRLNSLGSTETPYG